MSPEHRKERTSVTYNPAEIEKRVRQQWHEQAVYRTPNPGEGQPKFYCLDFFPYPSGAGLSVGHGKNYVPSDVVARYHRMKGEAVLHPMGWDAFGLPAENEAMKVGTHPAQSTAQYAAHYRHQLDLLGCSYDWEREINSSDPEFYRWNQAMFLMLYERGLAYRQDAPVNWCVTCQTVLAAEEIEEGLCWRCHQPVVIKKRKQWYIKVTSYAEELYTSLDVLDWPEHILNMQRHWIGRSEGVEIKLYVPSIGELSVFTTRADTLFGVTFVAISPEHALATDIADHDHKKQVTDYINKVAQRSSVERHTHEPDGVPTGQYADLPWGNKVPVYIADYILASYGTGAVMGVPAHDARDYAFARTYGIPGQQVVSPDTDTKSEIPFTGAGVLVNSQRFNGMPSDAAQQAITDWLIDKEQARRTHRFRLRDWLISRQRYWGTPIPIVHCGSCGEVPVPAEELPVLLPPMPDYQPRGDGRAPLANAPEFVQTKCPRCGQPAQRETDTMTGFVCSSWYYLRFVDPHNAESMFDQEKVARWLPVDMYVGGAEHAVGHLLYSRFWTKFLADAGVLSFREPFPVLRSQGVLHVRNPETGRVERMSKSKGNVVTPESVICEYGADVVRLYLLFLGPFEASVVWEVDSDGHSPQHIQGVRRFLYRVWRLAGDSPAAGQVLTAGQVPKDKTESTLLQALNRTIHAVTEQTEIMHFNVAISALMAFTSQMEKHRRRNGDTPAFIQCRWELVKLLAPFTPYIVEEIWQRLGGVGSVHHSRWPIGEEIRMAKPVIVIPVQVNGKVRARIRVSPDLDSVSLQSAALAADEVQAAIQKRSIRNVVVVPQRVVNIVLE